jgi:hypothetical protein
VLLIGEMGSGVGDLAAGFAAEFERSTIATYKASAKLFVLAIAKGLGVATQTDDEKPRDLTTDQLKESILEQAEGIVFVLPEAHRLPASLRYWLMDCMADGAQVMAIAAANPKKDLFLELLVIEAKEPSDEQIRAIMRAEARKYRHLHLSEGDLAELQSYAGKNPMLARKAIRSKALGIKLEKPEHSQYLDIWPLCMAFMCLLGAVRFVGMGTGDRSLYLIGGMAMMSGLAMRYAGQVKGAKRGLQ